MIPAEAVEAPLIFRQATNWTITTGATGLSLPNRERVMTAAELIETITTERNPL